jgi:hypothetical protein
MRRCITLVLVFVFAVGMVVPGVASASAVANTDVEIVLVNHIAQDADIPANGAFTSNIPGCEEGTAVDLWVRRPENNPPAKKAFAVLVEKQFNCDGGGSFSIFLHGAVPAGEVASLNWSLADKGDVAKAGSGHQASEQLGYEIFETPAEEHLLENCILDDPDLSCPPDHAGGDQQAGVLWRVIEETFTGHMVLDN